EKAGTNLGNSFAGQRMMKRVGEYRLLILVAVAIWGQVWGASGSAQERRRRVAVVTTVWRHDAHADVIASRLVQGFTLDGKGEFPRLKLASAYVDQFPPE